ncbi:S8 family serine peptidase [Fictibacillus aquaticus]|uniref:S8 family peptidase n=1 Tax=Fictibacillus aquaticus TaxID=2021314 RepID=UPI0013FD548C|nr:S8 family serine peptidase [Fictibacillus aquaticus]
MSNKWLKVTAALGLSVSLLGGPATAGASTKPAWQQNKNLLKNFDLFGHNVQMPEKKAKELSTDTLVLKMKKPITSTDLKKSGTTLVRSIPKLGYTVVKVKDKKKLQKAAAYFSQSSKVATVAPSTLSVPLGYADPKVSKQYFLKTLQVSEAQKLAGTRKVKVAVIDQGIDRKHPELDSRVSTSINMADPMNMPLADYHGTHVAGIIAGEKDNGIGGYGINQNVELISLDVFDRGFDASDYVIAEAILEAVNQGAKVINMSLGGSMSSPIMEEAVKMAVEKGVTIVAAAGNESSDSPSYPAAYEGVISVGSTNAKNELSSYSNFGPSVDVVAPGEDIYAPLYDYELKSMFYNLSGTSMASPMVAGLASLLLSKYPSLKPAEIEYIIEHTSKDLGSKGYDRKFAHGLIQPAAALKFNPKSIPSSVKYPASEMSEEEIFEAAAELSFDDEITKNAYFTKPNQVHWYKFPVGEGEKIQTKLTGVANYDYKLDIIVIGEDGMDMMSVNKHQDNETEAKLYTSPISGDMIIGVSDANSNYDDTTGKSSNYSLKISRPGVVTDKNTTEQPALVSGLPYTGTETIFNEEGVDSDFYKFSVNEEQVVKVTTSGIPGVDTSLNVGIEVTETPEGEDQEKALDGEEGEGGEGEETYTEIIASSDSKGIGYGEKMTFTAEPGVEYVVSTTNEMYMEEEFYFEGEFSFSPPEVSSLPYSIRLESKVFPTDEDGLSMGGGEEEEMEEEFGQEANMILESALPYSIGSEGTGYFQSFEDADYFKFTPTESGIYEFMFNEKAIPMATILKVTEMGEEVADEEEVEDEEIIEEDEDTGEEGEVVDEEEGEGEEEGEVLRDLIPISFNYDWGWEGVILNKSMFAGLEKGTEYVIQLNNDEMASSIPFDAYSFTSKKRFGDVRDSYEPNDDLTKKIKSLPTSMSVKGNFAFAGDIDPFYFRAKQDGIMNASLKKDTITSSMLKKYPKELLADYEGIVFMLEDVEGNQIIDEEDFSTLKLVGKPSYNGTTRGSFKTKKGQGYFVIALGFVMSQSNLSVLPYTLKLDSANRKDEDAGSVVKGNKPSKPLKLKKSGTTGFKYDGYLNMNTKGGDSDWLEYKVTKTKKSTITFATPSDNDGVINLYRDGKKVASANYYVDGDDEVLNYTVRPGTYYIEVKDRYGRSSTAPYKLSIK